MMNHYFRLFFIGFLISFSVCLAAQNKEDFNYIEKTNKVIYYEQWLNRNQWQMAHFFQNEIKEGTLNLIPCIIGMPIAEFSYKKDSSWIAQSISNQNKPDFKPFKNYFFDFWIQPDFKYQLGNFDNPIETKGGLSIYHQIPLGRGLSIFAGLHIPITNDYDEQPKQLRPAASYINYVKSFKKFNYLQASVGYFLADRYGYKLNFLHGGVNSRITWGIENSMTSYLYFFPKSVKYSPISEMVLLANTAYRFKKQDMIVKLTAGQFLYKDLGARFELIKQFTKAEISLFSLFSSKGSTLGIDLAFRIPPGKIIQKNRFRLRTGSEFPFQYLYSRGYGIAENFTVLTDLERTLRQFNTSYLNNESKRH